MSNDCPGFMPMRSRCAETEHGLNRCGASDRWGKHVEQQPLGQSAISDTQSMNQPEHAKRHSQNTPEENEADLSPLSVHFRTKSGQVDLEERAEAEDEDGDAHEGLGRAGKSWKGHSNENTDCKNCRAIPTRKSKNTFWRQKSHDKLQIYGIQIN